MITKEIRKGLKKQRKIVKKEIEAMRKKLRERKER